jgi:hypothetical protein
MSTLGDEIFSLGVALNKAAAAGLGSPVAPWFVSQPFNNDHPMRRVRAVVNKGAVLAHVNEAFGNGEDIASLIAAAPQMAQVLRDVAALLPSAGRMHPDDVFALQTRVCAVLAAAGAT